MIKQPHPTSRNPTQPRATLLFLGTGTSHGVPMIGCTCVVCTSSDPHDQRTRPSVYVSLPNGTRILIDTSPDLRAQALRHNLTRVDAVLFTHGHADHVLGLDDMRRFNAIQDSRIPCYGDARTIDEIRRTFSYVFDPKTPAGGGLPEIDLHVVDAPFEIGGCRIVPVPLWHGKRLLYGYRIGSLAYLTDVSRIPDESWPLIDGVDVLVLDALRHRPHPTHFSLSEALEATSRIRPADAWFTHICHDLGHSATHASLPPHVQLAYDGLSVDFSVD
ncbi:MAG TPA: MBL fold metallo-hydrolase [Vicinamibacterales bacterium]|nr:MBL fold metallo-hydrolase [Vicinamibacterales bacterium]